MVGAVAARACAALWCAAAAVGAVRWDDCYVRIGDRRYWNQKLFSDIEQASGLAVDYKTNTLYFSYIRNSTWFSARADLTTKVYSNIEELTGYCSFAVDQQRQQLHAGCSDVDGQGGGLYQFDTNPGRFVRAGEAGRAVRFVYFNNVLYYSVWDSLLLQTFRKGHGAREPELPAKVEGLVINKQREWIFHNGTGLYRQQSLVQGFDWPVALAAASSGVVYACDWGSSDSTRGIYQLHEYAPTATQVLGVKYCTGLTLDKYDDIIYAGYFSGIFKLERCPR